MQCPQCHAENREGSRFCAECGASLASACPDCGFFNYPGAKFCSGCGKALIAAVPETSTSHPATAQPSTDTVPPPQDASKREAAEAERRQLTVMFCDLVGSTALSERLDPEEYRDLLTVYQDAARGAINAYDGYIARYMGDGLLVYFCYPRAHEDDAERAVRAGLGVVDAVRGLTLGGDAELRVRIGIATGLVVVGDIVGEGASEERAVLGETPNLAARLQGLAAPDSVVIAEATRRMVEGRFELEVLKPKFVKGLSKRARAYRATAVRETTRFEASTVRGLTPFVGRESELQLLLKRWAQAKEGEGQVVMLSGEAGIGKSRILRELREHLVDKPHFSLRYQCSPYRVNAAFSPIIEQLQHAADFKAEDATEEKLDKLERLLGRAMDDISEAAPLLGALLSLPTDRYPALNMTAEKQKVQTIAVLVKQLKGLAAQQPVLLLTEDVHWMDPSTREVFDAVVAPTHELRVLAVLTHRPEFEPRWTGHGHVTHLSLNRLSRGDGRTLAERVTGGKAMPEQVLAQILDRTDGVPLFVEELTKTVLEAGILEEADGRYVLAGPLPPLSIPATLHDSLMARLDRLAPVKEVAQTAACIGREFSPELLAAVSPLERAALDDALEQLVSAELVFRRGAGELASYIFKHALVQDAAYESLLVSKRRQLHARIAHVLEERFPETVSTEPERLAQHYTAADMAEKAIPHWLAAGRRALSGSSLPEAISHLSKALELTANIDDAFDRAEHELEVRTALGAATMALYGWPAREMRDVVEPACDLFERGHGNSDAFMNFWNLWVHHGCRAEHREGLAVVDRMLKHSNKRKDPVLALVSSFTAAMANLWVGNYDLALAHESTALEVYEFERDKNLVWHYNHDPKNTLLSWASHRVWALGYPNKARALSDEAVAHARQVGHPFNLCWTLGNSSVAYGNCGEYDKACTRIEELRRIAQEQELIFMEAYMVPAIMSVVAAQEGKYETVYDESARAEEIWRAIGGRFWSPIVRACMTQACLHLGRSGEAVELINETIEQIESTGEFMFAEEIYRIAGLAHLEHARDQDGAISLFQKSFDYSKKHGTRSFELRTSMSLARLWREQGKRQEAHDLLAPIYNWFTEGFDTADLREAKALLEELS